MHETTPATRPPGASHVTLTCQFCLTPNGVDLARWEDRPKCGQCGRPFLVDRPVKVAEESFDSTVLGAEAPVLVDFYADWCPPCKVMAPILDEVARERAGALLVAKVDTDAAPAIAQRYGIRSIPTFTLFRNGRAEKSAVGAVGRSGIEELLKP